MVVKTSAVLYTMQGNASVKYKTGEIYKTDYYAMSVLLKKVDGVWKIAFGHASFPPLNMPSQ
jgi:ketosteroid isomerase-like protein